MPNPYCKFYPMNDTKNMVQVFVYGTLKPGEANYQNYCGGKVVRAIASYTWGTLYALPMGYPGMTVGKSKVSGVLLTFTTADILKSLDRLEDYQENRAAQLNEYYRQLVPVYSLEDELLGKAWSYFMNRAKVEQYHGVLIDSGCWTGRSE